jgi:Holliday junction resolvase RusA-like endonuclease
MIQQVNYQTVLQITLKGEPKSTSHIYAYHCKFGFPQGYMNKAGKDLKEDYQWQAKSQYRGKPIKGDIILRVSLYFGTKIKCDIDNFNKIVYDALTGIVWEDDSQIKTVMTTKYYDKKSPRIELEISTLKEK